MTVVLSRERLEGHTVCDCGVEQRETRGIYSVTVELSRERLKGYTVCDCGVEQRETRGTYSV